MPSSYCSCDSAPDERLNFQIYEQPREAPATSAAAMDPAHAAATETEADMTADNQHKNAGGPAGEAAAAATACEIDVRLERALENCNFFHPEASQQSAEQGLMVSD